MISLERREPKGGVGPFCRGSRSLSQRERPFGMALQHLRLSTAENEPFPRVLSDCLQHAKPRLTPPIALILEQTVGHESADMVENREVVAMADRGGGGHGKSVDEDGQFLQRRLVLGV